jgi:hypothetical protein
MPEADADSWPIRVDIQYEEEGPVIMCGGWWERTIINGSVWVEHCPISFSAESVAELRADIKNHLATWKHVESPLATISQLMKEAAQ